MTLDYESRQPRKWSIHSISGPAILAAAWVVFAIACNRAIHQRGYPPIDAHLQGMTLLWIAGVPLSALVEPFSRRRVYALIIYALVTGFIDAASWPMMTPNRFDPFACFVATTVFFGPIHLAITAALEGVFRLLERLWQKLFERRQISLAIRLTVAILLLVGTGFLPSIYATYNGYSLARDGQGKAVADWNNHSALIYVRDDPVYELTGNVRVEIHVDQTTGLMFRHDMGIRFEPAYNQKIAELITSHGKPSWAKPTVPSPSELARYLDANDFTLITTFPYDVTPNLTVLHGGTITKFGGVLSSGGPGLSVATPTGLYWIGNTAAPTFVARYSSFPRLIFIRDGHDSLDVFDDQGNLLAEVSKN